MRSRVAWLVLGLAIGLLAMGWLRWASAQPGPFAPLAGLATPGYIAVAVLFTLLLVRARLPMNHVGFGTPFGPRHLWVAIAAIAVLRVLAVTVHPWLEAVFGAPRDLGRFAGVEGSVGAMIGLLASSWTIAAFGEEIAYRIVLMRGIAYALGDGRGAMAVSLLAQAVLFGLIHAYQGPTGVAGSAVSGLVFGAATLAARWSIWPAALAHGVNNTIAIVQLYRG